MFIYSILRGRGYLSAVVESLLLPADKSVMRTRVCAAVLRDGQILMVNAVHRGPSGRRRDGEIYWTLPGGGVEAEETLEEAVVRELKEEMGLEGRVIQPVFRHDTERGSTHGFLVEVAPDLEAVLGVDPEYASDEEPALLGLGWFTLEEKKDDWMVKRVIEALGLGV